MALRSVSIAFSRKQPYRSMNAGVFRFWGLQPLRLANEFDAAGVFGCPFDQP